MAHRRSTPKDWSLMAFLNHDAVGDWLEPRGVVSVPTEAALVGLAVGAPRLTKSKAP